MPDLVLRKRVYDEAFVARTQLISLMHTIDAVSRKIEELPAEPGSPAARVHRCASAFARAHGHRPRGTR